MSESHGRCMFNFLGNSLFLKVVVDFTFPAADKSSSCSTSLLKLSMIHVFNFIFPVDV